MKGTGRAAKMLQMEQPELRAALWSSKELRVLGKLGLSAAGNWAHQVPEITELRECLCAEFPVLPLQPLLEDFHPSAFPWKHHPSRGSPRVYCKPGSLLALSLVPFPSGTAEEQGVDLQALLGAQGWV